MFVGSPALLVCGISLGPGSLMVVLIVLIDCLKVVIGCGDVMRRGKMMMLARRVALCVRHGVFPDR